MHRAFRAAASACVLVGLLWAAATASAQPRPGQNATEPAAADKAGKEIHARYLDTTAPRIDGDLTDAAWTLAPAFDDFVQDDPDNMSPARERTRVQVAYTDRTLFVAVRCFTDTTRLTTGLGRRDNQPPGDLVRLAFDPRHDHRTAYVFEVNPSGMQSDFLYFDDTQNSPDFDAVWDVRTAVDAEGWTAEFAIPFSQLRFSVLPGRSVVWGLNVGRDSYRSGEFDRWVATPRGAAGRVSRFGHLVFDAPMTPPQRLEVVPFTLARRDVRAGATGRQAAAGGADLRLGLGTAATVSATVNPDFGQVEQDPAVLNLGVFETFYPEKRAFFLEDSRLFVPNFPQVLLFHSRRIGRSPGRFALREGDTEIDRPDTTTILGAAKLTGKSGAWSYGGLSALTSAEFATVDSTTSSAPNAPIRSERLVEPRTAYSVARVLRDFREGSANLGAMVTSVNRVGDRDAVTGGLDSTWRWDDNRGELAGLLVGTHAPVNDALRSGGAVLANMNYGRKHWAVDGHYDYISPTFRNTDLGFLGSRANKSNVNYGVNLIQPDPRGPFRNLHAFSYGSRTWNDVGLRETYVGGGVEFAALNYWGASVRIHHDFENLDDLDSRGGPPVVHPSGWLADIFLRTDSRKTMQGSLSFDFRRDAVGGWTFNASPNLKLRPTSRMQASVGVQYQSGLDLAQWIDNRDVTGDGVVDYVFGRLHRNVLGITTRATYAFSRDMTLEAYLQPFVAVGDYSHPARLSRPRSFQFEPVTLPFDPDFNTKSLRSNVVFRWEYQKGSALFLVWNSTTSDDARPGEFSPGRDLASAISGRASHVLIVKLTYWLGR